MTKHDRLQKHLKKHADLSTNPPGLTDAETAQANKVFDAFGTPAENRPEALAVLAQMSPAQRQVALSVTPDNIEDRMAA